MLKLATDSGRIFSSYLLLVVVVVLPTIISIVSTIVKVWPTWPFSLQFDGKQSPAVNF